MTLTIVVIVFCLLVLWRDRKDHQDRLIAHKGLADAVLAQLERARRDWQAERRDLIRQADRERQVLLNRIKPSSAQYIPSDEPMHTPEAVSMFDDEDFWESKEELADRAMAAELAP